MRNYPLIIGVALALLIGLFVYAYRTPPQVLPAGWVAGEFGGVSLRLELATTTAEQELGLGGRASLPLDYGMLFVFSEAGYYGFWMKDTLIPLDIFWLNDQGQVVWMEQSVATSTYPHVFYPSTPARYVLEASAGFGALHGVATGTPLSLQNHQ
jgi:uncharacterized membrane protein (UPF0127 family)